MTLAVTGATGFVGRALLEEAGKQGVEIRALTRRPQRKAPGLEWIPGDLHDRKALRRLVPVPVTVLHTRCYALVVADDPGSWLPVLEGGVVMSGTRYLRGDGMTARDLRDLAATGRRSAIGTTVVDALSAPGSGVRGVPAFDLDVASPTTIGLGDSFIGGMVAALELTRRDRASGPPRGADSLEP